MKLQPFENRVWLSSPTMHGEEEIFVKEAFETNWVSTVGKNIDELEKGVVDYLGEKLYAAGLSSGTSALHLAFKLAGVKRGERVFCSNLTFGATVNPVSYEGAEPVFIESEYESWNMSPKALEKAFSLYPDTKCVVVADLYGTPANYDEIKRICESHKAILIEDAAESFGAEYRDQKAGTFGDFNVISFNGNKIITTSGGGMLLSGDKSAIAKAKFLSTQAREPFPWYEHKELGYNYRLSNILAGIGRGQLLHLDEHIQRKKEIYERYKEGLQHLPVKMNPIPEGAKPNYWLSCLLIEKEAMAPQDRNRYIPQVQDKKSAGTNSFLGRESYRNSSSLSLIERKKSQQFKGVDFKGKLYLREKGKTSPEEIREVLAELNIESRPIWKPMRLQPLYSNYKFVTKDGEIQNLPNDYVDVDSDIFERGICLPSDIKMKKAEQEVVIETIKQLFLQL